MRAKISPCISSCRVVRGASPEEILKTKNAGDAISGHFAMQLQSRIYLNYAYLQIFQRRKSPFIPCCLNVFEARRASSVGCAYRLVSRRSRIQSSRPAHSFVDICMVMKKYSMTIVSLPLIQEGQLSVTGERMCTKYW